MQDLSGSERFMNIETLRDILSEFEWPAPYELEDDLPDGIVVAFPACNLYFSEGYLGDVELEFLPEDTGVDEILKLGHALLVIVPESERIQDPLTPGLINDQSIEGSLKKVQNGLRDLCKIVLTHLQPCVLGNFSWVETYLKKSGG